MNYDSILRISPWVEVIVKSLYWRSNLINKYLAKRAPKVPVQAQSQAKEVEELHFDLVTTRLRELGVGEGEIMIVHSSWLALKPTGLSPVQICARLVDFLGPAGTLAMPAIPLYRDEPTGPARLSDAICEKRLSYDVRKTPPWTGALPKALMGVAGSVRSRHPLNSMVAVGQQAASMMKANIDGDRPMACGPGSSWKFCADHNATIVCFGVDTAHSLTMIHVAEDSWADQWPIPNWYRDRMFYVKDGEFEANLTVRERRPRWAINYGERTLQKDLIAHGILNISYVGQLRIEVCQSAMLVDFLNTRKSSGYPYWVPFWDRL
jgi:aminoglycoside 3-N-acetyltransferase